MVSPHSEFEVHFRHPCYAALSSRAVFYEYRSGWCAARSFGALSYLPYAVPCALGLRIFGIRHPKVQLENVRVFRYGRSVLIRDLLCIW